MEYHQTPQLLGDLTPLGDVTPAVAQLTDHTLNFYPLTSPLAVAK